MTAGPRTAVCSSCGAIASPGSKFCASCGRPLNPLAAAVAWPEIEEAASRRVQRVQMSFRDSVRFGAGFAVGVTVVGFILTLAYWLIALLIIGSILRALTAALPSNGQAAAGLTWPFGEPAGQLFEGRGSADSVPIALDGPYRVEWSAGPTSPAACPLNASVRSPARPAFETLLVSASIPFASPRLGNTVELTLDSGMYVVHVDSACTWSFRFVPRR